MCYIISLVIQRVEMDKNRIDIFLSRYGNARDTVDARNPANQLRWTILPRTHAFWPFHWCGSVFHHQYRNCQVKSTREPFHARCPFRGNVPDWLADLVPSGNSAGAETDFLPCAKGRWKDLMWPRQTCLFPTSKLFCTWPTHGSCKIDPWTHEGVDKPKNTKRGIYAETRQTIFSKNSGLAVSVCLLSTRFSFPFHSSLETSAGHVRRLRCTSTWQTFRGKVWPGK